MLADLCSNGPAQDLGQRRFVADLFLATSSPIPPPPSMRLFFDGDLALYVHSGTNHTTDGSAIVDLSTDHGILPVGHGQTLKSTRPPSSAFWRTRFVIPEGVGFREHRSGTYSCT
jgi:hypothetical protein